MNPPSPAALDRAWFPVLAFVIALVCYAVAAWYVRRRRAWSGTTHTTTSGRQFYWKVSRHKGRPVGSWLGIDAESPLDFTLEPEGWFHRLSGALGFCSEFQTGDVEFDRRVFIRSDEGLFQQALQSDSHLHALVMDAFAKGAAAIFSTPTMLAIKMRQATSEPPDTADSLVDTLASIDRRLPRAGAAVSGATPIMMWRSVFAALPFFVIAVGLAGGFLRLLHGSTIIRWDLWWPVVGELWGAVVIASLVAIRLLFRRSSYGHLVLKNFLFPAVLMLVPSAFLVGFINCAYDLSEPRVHFQTVARKSITHGSKGDDTYHLVVDDWRAPNRTVTVSVPRQVFEGVGQFDRVEVVDHQGLFGVEWIDPIALPR